MTPASISLFCFFSFQDWLPVSPPTADLDLESAPTPSCYSSPLPWASEDGLLQPHLVWTRSCKLWPWFQVFQIDRGIGVRSLKAVMELFEIILKMSGQTPKPVFQLKFTITLTYLNLNYSLKQEKKLVPFSKNVGVHEKKSSAVYKIQEIAT